MIATSDQGSVRILTICRAQRRNALDEATIVQLRAAIAAAHADPWVRALVLTGEGGLAFCSGSDMKAAQSMTLDERIAHAKHGQELMDELSGFELLTVAAVEGYALGGGLELALACDVIVSGETGVFGMPEVRRSAIPSWGGTYRLSRAVGLAAAKNMLLGGRTYSAAESLALGLVCEVVPAGGALARAVELAVEMAGEGSARVVALAKSLLNGAMARSDAESRAAEFAAECEVAALDGYGSGV